MSKNKHPEPWKVPGVPWKTESSFWAWIRGVLRNGWKKHPVKLEYIKANRKRIPNPKPSTRFPEVWGMTCTCCGKDVVQSEIEIDHISDTGGTFTGLDDIKDYAAYLFLIDFTSIRAVCKPCHKIITHAQKLGITFKEAKAAKDAIEFCKKPKEEVLAYLEQMGYNGSSVSTSAKRKALIEKLFMEEACKKSK
jgi:hypothetical protein